MPTVLDPSGRARAQRAAQHLAVTPAATALLALFYGALTPVQWGQVGLSLLGAVGTWLARNRDVKGRRYLQSLVPVLTALATALIPLVTPGGALSDLTDVAGVIPLLHLLAGLGNAVTNTPTPQGAVVAGQVTHEQAVTDVAAPPVARTGGDVQRAISTDTTTLQALTDADIAAHAARTQTPKPPVGFTAAPPPSGPGATPPAPAVAAPGDAPITSPSATSRRLSLRGDEGGRR